MIREKDVYLEDQTNNSLGKTIAKRMNCCFVKASSRPNVIVTRKVCFVGTSDGADLHSVWP